MIGVGVTSMRQLEREGLKAAGTGEQPGKVAVKHSGLRQVKHEATCGVSAGVSAR